MNEFVEWIKSQTKPLIITGIIILVALFIIIVTNFFIKRFLKRHKRKRAITVARLLQNIVRYTVVILSGIAIINTL